MIKNKKKINKIVNSKNILPVKYQHVSIAIVRMLACWHKHLFQNTAVQLQFYRAASMTVDS